MSFKDWILDVPYDEITAEVKAENNKLEIITLDKKYSYAKMKYRFENMKEKSVYSFQINMDYLDVNYKLIFTWFDEKDKAIMRGYLSNNEEFISPEKASSLEVGIIVYSKIKGRLTVSDVKIEYLHEYKEKIVTLAAIHIDYTGKRTCEMNLFESLSKIDEAAQNNADIIVLTECMYDRRVDVSLEEGSISLEDEPVKLLQEKAREKGIYLAFSIHEKKDGLFYNTGVLIGKTGGIVGLYRKSHLTLSEIEKGIIPGDDFPVFDTEFGKIAIVICWDMWFPEMTRELFKKGVRIICNPTAGYCDYQTRARARDNGFYIITAGVIDHEHTRIVDPECNVIDTATNKGYAVATVDINKPLYVYWLSVGPAYAEGRNVYMHERRPDLYTN